MKGLKEPRFIWMMSRSLRKRSPFSEGFLLRSIYGDGADYAIINELCSNQAEPGGRSGTPLFPGLRFRRKVKEPMIHKMMIDAIETSYIDVGQGKTLLLLHGWGASKEAFSPVIEELKARYRIIAPDWPGCGQTPEPTVPWTVDDYRLFLEKFISVLDLRDITALGHSHGGRVLIRWASTRPPVLKKLILVDSAGIRPKRGIGWYFRVYTYKAGKSLLKIPFLGEKLGPAIKKRQAKAGSEDYRNASPRMKQTMSKVLGEDMRPSMPQIAVPTLLIWGDRDTATPLEDGRMMEKLIPGAGLAVLKPAGHYSYLDQLPQFLRIVAYFMEH